MPTYFDPIKGDVEYIPESIVNGGGGGSGDVEGPASSTDNAVARFDGTTGKIIQNSGVIVDDTNNVTVPGVIFGPNGAASAPSYSFTNNTNMGMWRIGSNILGIGSGGSTVIRVSSGNLAGGSNFSYQISSLSSSPSSPTFSFRGNDDTGMYRVGADTIGFTTGGTNALTLEDDQTSTFAGALRAPDGTNAAPSYSFASASNTGFRVTGTDMACVTNGSLRFLITTNDFRGTNAAGSPLMKVGASSVSAPGFSFVGDTNTGMYSDAADTLKLATGGTNALTLEDDQTSTFAGALRAPDGSNAAPSYSFSGDTNTGVRRPFAGGVSIVGNGNELFRFSSTGMFSTPTGSALVKSNAGTVSTPAFSFASDTNTGMYRVTANTLGFTTGGTNALTLESDQTAVFSAAAEFPGIGTTASAANAVLDGADNTLLLSTSSLRYKTEVEDLDTEYSERVLNLRPVWYRSLATHDRKDWSWYGLIAEEVAEVEPRLVRWGYLPSDFEEVTETREVELDGETEEETVTKRQLKEGAQLVPDGVQYERVVVLLLDVVKRLEARVKSLEERLK